MEEDVDFHVEIEDVLPQLVDYCCQNFEWLLEKIRFFLPNVDLGPILQIPDDKIRISILLQELRSTHGEVWNKIIQCLCMEGVLPIELEIQLLSAVGEGTEGDTVRSCFSSEVSGIKRQRLDFTEVYKQKITGLLLEKYGFKTKEASSRHFNKMFVEPLIHEQGKSTKEKQKSKEALGTFSATEESIDSINLSQLFERNSLSNTNVILLVGMPGTGKTILTHWICYEWASGGFSHFKLTFLFEFRQLNLISKSVSLRELLFNLFLMPDANSEEVYQYILEHPQYVLILFDGLDEFVGQISHDSSKINPDPNCAVSISQLFSSLLHGMVLCGCTVVVTCRSKILNSIPISSVDIVAEVLGFNQEKVEEYVKCFFPSEELKAKSLFYLKENHKLMHMCFVPALCHIVCMCLEHLLHSSLSPTQLPQTITQFYIKMLSIFLWKEHKSSATEKTMLKTFRPLISELCNLALKGLDERKTVFYVKDISEDLKGFAPRHGLLSVFDVKKIEGSTDLGYSFVHLSSQEFFAALYLMISRTVTETELYKKLSLKSKWNLKYKTKEEFTENVHIFLSGLSSKECQSFLNELTEHSMGLVQKKQQTIIKCLVKLAKTQLTGPKLIELCHCTYETQDLDLAQRVGKQLELKYYFKNFRISPADMTALSFVINQGTCSVCLDFAGCPMEPDCLDILGKCENLQSLSFRNRKYGDSFAQALSKCLAGRKTLQTIRLTGGRLTSIGVAALTQSYLSCPQLQEIIMQDNRLKLEDMVMCLEVFSKMKQLKKIDLSNNEINMKSALALSKVAAKCPSITDVQISGDSNTVIFLSASLTQPSLENCSLTSEEVPQLVHILKDLSPLTDVNLSGNALEDRGCKELVNSLPDIHISGKLRLDKIQLSAEGILYLVSSMVSCPTVNQVDVRCLQQTAALYFLVDKAVEHREIRISGFWAFEKALRKLCSIFQQCNNLTSLDLSGNKISLDEVIALAESFSSIENMTDVTISMAGSQKLLVTFQDLKRHGTFLIANKDQAASPGISKTFSLTECLITRRKLRKLFLALERCPALTQINLSNNSLSYQMIENVLKYLPVFPNLTFLNISKNDFSPNCVLLLADSINLCNRIKEVDIRSTETMCLHLEKQHKATEVVCRLISCKIGKNDVDQLMKIFQHNTNLIEVNMHMNSILEEGILVLLSSLSSCSRVTEINACLHPEERIHIKFSTASDARRVIWLSEYSFQAEHLRKLSCLFENCNIIHFISKNNAITMDVVVDFLTVLSRKRHAFAMSIEEPWVGGQNCISLLNELTQAPAKIGAFQVYTNSVTIELKGSEDCLHPSSLSCFQELELIRFNDCGMEENNLHFLNSIIMQCTRLSELNLSHNRLGDAGIKVLADLLVSLTSLKTIVLESVNMTHIGMIHITESLRHCRSIQNINFSHNDIGETGAIALANVLPQKRNLQIINVSHCFSVTCDGGRRFILELSKIPELQEIYLDSVNLDDAALLTLSQGLLQVPSIKALMFSGNKFTHEGVSLLTEHLSSCTIMEKIDLSCSVLNDFGAERLSEVLPSMKNLRKLNLSRTNIGPAGGIKLAEALGSCGILEELFLSDNKFGESCLLKLAQGFQHLKQLKKIDLKYCEISDSVSTSLAAGFGCCRNLEELILSWNKIGDKGSYALACALKQMRNLKKLDLEKNHITGKGAEEIAETLSGCAGIHVVRLWNNPIPVPIQDKLQKQDSRLNFSFF